MGLAVSKKKLEETPRGEIAEAVWKKIWFTCYPSKGRGRFIYHHHWRGLTEEEIDLSDEELFKRGQHSVHGDLRFEFDNGLWGFTVFLGTAEENKGEDRLMKGEPLRGAFKPVQPKEWLRVGVRKPYVSEPGGIGSTSKKYSKIFVADKGSYEIGVWRQHFFEIFLHGEKLRGRYIIAYAPLEEGGQRVWLISKPEDETPYADRHEIEEVIEELRQKKQRFLIWAKPGMKPQLIDVVEKRLAVGSERTSKWFSYLFSSFDEDYHYVWAPILVPGKVDRDGDLVPYDEVVKAVHRFMQTDMDVYLMHDVPLDGKAKIVECATVQGKLIVGGEEYPPGTAVCGIAVYDDSLWNDILCGKYRGLSIRALVKSVDKGHYRELHDLRILEVSIVDDPAVKDATFKVVKRAEVKLMAVESDVKQILEELTDLLPDAEDTKYHSAIAACISILSQVLYGASYGYPGYGYPEASEKKEEAAKSEEEVPKEEETAKNEEASTEEPPQEIVTEKHFEVLEKIEEILSKLAKR